MLLSGVGAGSSPKPKNALKRPPADPVVLGSLSKSGEPSNISKMTPSHFVLLYFCCCAIILSVILAVLS